MKKNLHGNSSPGIWRKKRLVLSGGLLATVAGFAMAAHAVEPATVVEHSSATALHEIDGEIERLQKALEEAREKRSRLADGSVTPAGNPSAAPSQPVASEEKTDLTLDTVVVRARNREERLQDVPIPVSVMSGKELERDGAVNISDFARKSTNVQAAELNSRRSSVSIRGVGKNVNGEEFEAPVGVIIDNVFQPYVGASWANFTDIDRIEVARGPQGTLLGKNTTLGVLNVSTKLPSFKPDATVDASFGERHAAKATGSLTGPIADNLLAYRFSFYADKADGSIRNIAHNESTWYDRNRVGGRLQFLVTPTADLSARIILQHASARENINMSPTISDPATYRNGDSRSLTFSSRLARSWFGGYKPLLQDFTVDADYVTPSIDKQNSVSTEINWNLGGHTLTSISAYKDNLFVADNDFDKTHFDIRRGGGARTDQSQLSEELRLSSAAGGVLDYQTGIYALSNKYRNLNQTPYGEDAGAFYATNPQYTTLNSSAAGRELLRQSLNNVYIKQETAPETSSLGVFGQANWHFSERGTLTAGLRQTHEKKTNTWKYYLENGGVDLDQLGLANGATAAQIAAAKALRAAQVGSSAKFGPERSISESSNSTSALLSPSFKLDSDNLVYASVARGVKSGAVSWNSSDGSGNITKPEKAIDFELGIKSSLLERRLVLNLNLYRTNIADFQTNQVVNDATVTGGTRSVIGNAKKVVLQGLELDGNFQLLSALSLRFGAAIGKSIYQDYRDAPCPADAAATVAASCDFSGRQLPGAPKRSANLGLEYRTRISSSLLIHANVNNTYTSKQNVALNLSDYGWQSARNITDVGIGFGSLDGKFDFNLFAKNLFDKKYAVDVGSFSATDGVSARWGDRRFVGVSLRAKL